MVPEFSTKDLREELKSNAKQRWIMWFPQGSPIVLSKVQDDKSLYISLVFLHQSIKIRNILPCKEAERSTIQTSELNIDSIWRKGQPPQSKDLCGIWNSTTSLLKMPKEPTDPYPLGIQDSSSWPAWLLILFDSIRFGFY